MEQRDLPRFEWKAGQYHTHDRSNDWYWILGILATIGIALSIVFKNYLLSILIALGATMIAILAGREHPELQVEIGGKGIRINRSLHSYKKIRSFWIYQAQKKDGTEYRMILEVDRPIIPFFTVPLGSNVNPSELRQYLRTHILEKEHREPALDGIIRNLKL